MKTTHTIQDVEGLILEKLAQLRDSNNKTEQRQLRSQILKLEKHFNDCNEKHLNGKKYPKKVVPKDIPKKELLALIDSVSELDCVDGMMTEGGKENHKRYIKKQLDLSGVFITARDT